MTAPAFVANTMATSCGGAEPLNGFDVTATVLFVFFVVIESIADNQQYSFQLEKELRAAQKRLTGEFADGFLQSGLFSVVRKPNYAAEQAIWISFFLFSIGSGAPWWNWSGIGWFLLVFTIFSASGWFTEKISQSKYPKYLEYMKRVPLFVPNTNPFSCNNKKKR
jgi:steroid 5-alpha reductase family enzyme